MIKLSDVEREILAEASVGADRSVASLARALKRKEHTIRDALNHLSEQQVIRRVWIVDLLQLGLHRFQVLLSAANNGKSARKRLLETICGDPRVSFVADLGGEYDHEFVALCRNPHQLAALFEKISEEGCVAIGRKVVGIQDELHIFSRKHLSPKIGSGRHFVLGGKRTRITLDEKDHRILKALQDDPDITKKALAEICETSVVTIDTRIKTLSRNQILVGVALRVDSSRLGLQNVKLLLTASSFKRAQRSELLQFVKKHPHCTNFRPCLSTADYEIGVEISEPSQLRRLKEDLLEQFEDQLTHIEVIPRFQIHKYAMYPFQTFRQLVAE